MKSIITVLTIMLLSTNLFAADGSSGCGPGWYAFKDNSLLSSALRATTNGVFAVTVTIGMTLGTSGCTKHSIVKREKENIKFATENYFEITSNGAKGDGQFLSAYGELMGCAGESLDLFKSNFKNNLNKMFNKSSIDPKSLLKETYIMILKDKNLKQACFSA